MNLLDTLKIPCPWKCCEISKNSNVNSTVFWNNLKRLQWKSKNGVFFNEKKFTLSDECALIIGTNPEDQFEVIARLEIPWNNCIILRSEEVLNFINSVEEEFQPNELYPTYDEGHTNINRAKHIQIIALEQKLYKIKVGAKQLKLDEKILFALSQKASMIKSFTKILDLNRKKYESYLLKLLHHFCYNKSHNESVNLSNTIYIHHFFEECNIFHCDCIDKSFIIELAVNFTDWFIHCIPSFVKTIMISESIRLETFSDCWPHENTFIDINTMSKTGLYYTGMLDCVECAFCNIKIHKWQRGDDPVVEHYKYSTYCPLLWRPKETANIGVGCESQLLALLSTSTKNAASFDEIDCNNEHKM